jgi:HPt (histidine-containing phosphotransfer) domain-containing protein
MPLHLQRIEWMASPPLAPFHDPIDLQHLRRMTLGDEALEREVLGLFATQVAGLMAELAALPPQAALLVHKIKGSARGIGAFAVAEAAEELEAALRGDGEPMRALAQLDAAVGDVDLAIAAVLKPR